MKKNKLQERNLNIEKSSSFTDFSSGHGEETGVFLFWEWNTSVQPAMQKCRGPWELSECLRGRQEHQPHPHASQAPGRS